MKVLADAEIIIDGAAKTRMHKILRLLGQHVAAAAYLTTGVVSAHGEVPNSDETFREDTF